MSSEALKAFIAKERSSGSQDQDIFLKMLDTPAFRAGIEKGNKQGLTNRQIAAGIGLKLPERKAVDVEQTKKESLLAEAKKAGKTKTWESGLIGVSDLGAGVLQGVSKIADTASAGINKAFGTNLDTGSYDRVTRERKAVEEWHNLRREANDQGFDWGRLGGQITGTAPMAALGRGYQGAKILSAAGAKVAGQNALVGAGIGGAGFAENADARLSNLVLGAVGGGAGAAVGEKIAQGVGKSIQTVKNTTSKFSTTQTNQLLSQINQKLDDALRQNGMSLGELPEGVVNSMRQEALKALQSGKDLNTTAVARKAVLDKLGIKGTQAQVTGDAKQWQQQAELAKVNGAGDPLREKFIDDNVQLTRLLNEAADSTRGASIDSYGAMENALESIRGQLAQNKEYIRSAYDLARNAPGNDVLINGAGLSNDVFTKLDDAALASFLPPDIQKKIVQIGNQPELFTLKKGQELVAVLNDHYKPSLSNGQPTATTHAIGIVRRSLQDRLDEATQGLIPNGNDAAQAYQFARQAHGFNAKQIESMPLLQDAVKGVEPDKLFNQHILKGNVSELSKTIELLNNVNPQAVNDIKQQVVQFISQKSINSNGQFSPAGMKKALDQITDRRLATMFNPQELSKIKDIAKAADYLITQPPHSYVNNSNSGSSLVNYFMQFINKAGVRKLPLMESIADLGNSRQVSKAMQPTITGEAVQTQTNQDLIDRLTRAGLISGSNLPIQ